MSEKFIDWAKKRLGNNAIVTKEAHGDRSHVFRICNQSDDYFLKIGGNFEKEIRRLNWLKGKLPVPNVIDFIKIGKKEALLLSAIGGKNLAVLRQEWKAEKVVSELADALRRFHAIDVKDCPFGEFDPGDVLVHGDACMPNFIFFGDSLSGYIDLGDVAVDKPEIDFAAAIWSLQYNLGKGYGLKFLENYGVENATEELVEKLRLQYEDMQKKWGL